MRLSFESCFLITMLFTWHVAIGAKPSGNEFRFYGSGGKFKNISVEDGLSQSTVYCIMQDNLGFLWFGTRGGGLNKYDGYTFHEFKNIPDDSTSLSNNEVTSVFQDNKQRIWVGTREGLNLLNKNGTNFKRYLNNPYDTCSISGNSITDIANDSKGNVWVGTNNGINLLCGSGFIHSHIFEDKVQQVRDIESGKKKLYITDNQGLYIYQHEINKVTFIPYADIMKNARLQNKTMPVLALKNGNAWLGTDEGVKIIDYKNQIIPLSEYIGSHQVPNNAVRDFVRDKNGNIWIGTIEGLYRVNLKNKTIHYYIYNDKNPDCLSHNSIYSILQDRDSTIWIGTWGGGVNIYNDKLWKFGHYFHQSHNIVSLSGNVVSAFAENAKGLFVGVELGGVNFLPGQSNEFIQYRHNPNNAESLTNDHVKTLYIDIDSNLWVGTFNGGLNHFNTQTGAFTPYLEGTKVFSIANGPRNNLWVGTIGGLYRRDKVSGEWQHFTHNPHDPASLGHNFVLNMYLSSKNELWIATKEAGLHRFTPSNDTFERYTANTSDTNSLISNYIIAITEDKNNQLLVGTSLGINIYNAVNNNFTNLHIPELPDYFINGILVDQKNNYWISTNKGISKYNPNTKSCINYNISDGLQSNEFNRNACYQSRNGDLYFGGINGFNYFNPNKMVINKQPPPIQIISFKIANQTILPGVKNSVLEKPIWETKHITLSHKQADITFEFAALNYIHSEKNQYAYMLEGYNNNWIYTGNGRQAIFTSLKPGKYTFRVKGSNNDGYWNNQGTSLSIHIKPPFWKTWLFRIMAVASIWFLIYKYQRYRKKAEREEILIINQKLQEGDKIIDAKMQEVEQQRQELIKRDEQEKEIRYFNVGIARFSEIFSKQYDTLQILNQQVLVTLIEYIEGSMGAIYIVNDEKGEQPHLEMVASYAANIQNMFDIKITIGEGNVGTCYKEAKTMVCKHIPENFYKLASGLGETKPKHLILIPVMQVGNVQGVIEIASFEAIEAYKIHLIEKITENLASLITVHKANTRMKNFLAELHEQQEELQAQDEELRQNLEEMTATQEEMERHRENWNSEKIEMEEKLKFMQEEIKKYKVQLNIEDSGYDDD